MSPFYCQTSKAELDSTPTLVDPLDTHTFAFNRSSVINATIYCCARPVYKIVSNEALSVTRLTDLSEEKVVASIKRRHLFSDLVVFPHRGNKPMKIKKWLKTRSSCVSLQTLEGTFIWRSETVGSQVGSHRFALYFQGQDDIPVAYSKSTLEPPTMSLILKPGLENVLVEIITSFLVLEHKFRIKEEVDKQMNLTLTFYTQAGAY